MNIAVLSGKGGTGKTLVSVNLAAVARTSTYIDCDVEEPNGHLFFKPENMIEEHITVPVPKVNETLCTGCRKCVEFCAFHALAYIKDQWILFDEVCHSCKGCILVCPQSALSQKEKAIGRIQSGQSQQVQVYTGILNTGEASGTPIIQKLLHKNKDHEHRTTLIDCPPGSACIVMESIKDADYCVLVGEPTLFGLHNLKMVYELVQLFKKPFGVILNKYDQEDNPVEKFCLENGITILGKIPFDKELGRLNSNGYIVSREKEEYEALFTSLLHNIQKEVHCEATINS